MSLLSYPMQVPNIDIVLPTQISTAAAVHSKEQLTGLCSRTWKYWFCAIAMRFQLENSNGFIYSWTLIIHNTLKGNITVQFFQLWLSHFHFLTSIVNRHVGTQCIKLHGQRHYDSSHKLVINIWWMHSNMLKYEIYLSSCV